MIRPLVIALVIAFAFCLWQLDSLRIRHTQTKADLATALEVNKANRVAMEQLQASFTKTDEILAAWNSDRTTLSQVRATTRKAIQEAMQDENFRIWRVAPVPADAFRMLANPVDAYRTDTPASAPTPSGTVRPNTSPGIGQ